MTKAIRIHRNGDPDVLRWEDIDLPSPADGEVRIRHTAIAVNFSDINVRRGGFYLAKPLQFPLISATRLRVSLRASVRTSTMCRPATGSPMSALAVRFMSRPGLTRKRATYPLPA